MNRRRFDFSSVFQDNVFPQLMYITRQNFSLDKKDRPMHMHEKICELNLVHWGKGTYNVDGTIYPVKMTDAFLTNCGQAHELLSSESSPLTVYCLGYRNVLFKGLPENFVTIPGGSPVRSCRKDYSLLWNNCEKLLDLDLGRPDDQALANLLAATSLMIARNAPESLSAQPVSVSNDELTKKVKDYIADHFREDIRLDDIARETNFSITYISHTFKKATGYSPIEYVIRRRIGYAQTLLISSDFSVSHIATLAGYDNPKHFQNIFKKTVGITPLQYRRQYLHSLKGARDQR